MKFINKTRIFEVPKNATLKIQQTRSYLAEKYGLCRQTITKLLAERCGITHNSHLTPLDLEIFIQKVGTPDQFKKAVEMLKN